MSESPEHRTLGGWIRTKDPGYLAVKRSVRAAVVMPAVFWVAHVGFTNSQVSLFAAFGSFALLLLVDFAGRPRVRSTSYLILFAVGCAFIALGTLVSTHKVLAVAAMAVMGFLVLFAGIVNPLAATGATAALLVFVLPVAVAAPPSQIGPRLLGWLLAGAVAIPACLLVWPTPWHDTYGRRLSSALKAVARVAEAQAPARPTGTPPRSWPPNSGSCATQFRARLIRRPARRPSGRPLEAGGPGRVGGRQRHPERHEVMASSPRCERARRRPPTPCRTPR